jgi:transcriptional regulator GlxA family with amidase domain
MSTPCLNTAHLRDTLKENGFSVKVLAIRIGMDVRTLERHFRKQFRITPTLLAEGLSNKQVAASLSYTCESNFCRDFKRYFGRAPQAVRTGPKGSIRRLSRFDKKLSRFDKSARLPRQG